MDASMVMGTLQASRSPEHLVPEPEATSQHGQVQINGNSAWHSVSLAGSRRRPKQNAERVLGENTDQRGLGGEEPNT